MGIARRIGHLSYRSEPELQARFGRAPQPGEDPLGGATAPAEAEGPGAGAEHGRYAVESYLDHHADKLARRFDAGSYVVLSEAMNHHDVGRGRGGLAQALGAVRCRVAVAGIDSDRLYPLRLQQELAELLPGRPEVTVISSLYGHDSFLIESEAVGNFIRAALEDDAAGVEERAG
jgi:homoserine O-acetyltransferase